MGYCSAGTASAAVLIHRVDVGNEVVDEVVLGQPGEAVLVDVEMRQGGTPRYLLQQSADRLAFIQPERGDVDRTNEVGRVLAERGDDLAAVGVPGNEGWPVLAGRTWRSRATSSASLVIGNWGAVTWSPSACKRSMTALQLEPSAQAQAPCTRTMLGCAVMSGTLGPGRPFEGRGESALEGVSWVTSRRVSSPRSGLFGRA